MLVEELGRAISLVVVQKPGWMLTLSLAVVHKIGWVPTLRSGAGGLRRCSSFIFYWGNEAHAEHSSGARDRSRTPPWPQQEPVCGM